MEKLNIFSFTFGKVLSKTLKRLLFFLTERFVLASLYCKHECCIIAKKVVELPSIPSFRIFLIGFGCVYQTVHIVVPVYVSCAGNAFFVLVVSI